MIPSIQVPDFAGTIMRGRLAQQQGELSRLQMMAQEAAAADADAFRTALREVGPGLGSAVPEERRAALTRMANAGVMGAQFALPMMQRDQERAEDMALRRQQLALSGRTQPTEFDRLLGAAGIQPGSPEAQALARTRLTPQGPAPMSVAPGATLVDPRTGTPIFTAPERAPTPGETERLFARYSELASRPLEELSAGERAQFEALRGRLSGQQNNVNVRLEQGPQVGTIPPGFQVERTPEGALRMAPIPGGPAARQAEEAASRETARQQGQQRAGNVVLQDIDRVLENLRSSRFPVAGFGADVVARVPGTGAADVARLIDTIGANIRVSQLNQMRQESPTGAALGNVTNQEGERMEAMLGSLSQAQSPEQFRRNLERLRDIYLDIIHGPGNRPGAQTAGPGNRGTAEPPPPRQATPQQPQRLRFNPQTGEVEPAR